MAITYTLGGLVARIEDDLARSDLNAQIRVAIETAINTLKVKKFWFNATRDESFPTAVNQESYSSSDDASIPLMLEITGMILEDEDGIRHDLGEPIDPVTMELLQGAGPATGRPVDWSYFNETFSFYPVPDSADYTIIPMGWIKVAMPTSDATEDNVWMTHGFETVRSEAKAYLYTHVIKDASQAAAMVDAAQGAQGNLDRQTSMVMATGHITATDW